MADAELVLRSWVLEKALYEVRYELNSRPDWVDIPLRAVLTILGNRTREWSAGGRYRLSAADAKVHRPTRTTCKVEGAGPMTARSIDPDPGDPRHPAA